MGGGEAHLLGEQLSFGSGVPVWGRSPQQHQRQVDRAHWTGLWEAKVTLTAPSRQAEFTQTPPTPTLWGSLPLNNCGQLPCKVSGVCRTGDPQELTRAFSGQNKCSDWPGQAPSNIHLLEELGD